VNRSEINRLQREALALFAEHRFALPPFVTWSEADWNGNPETADFCRCIRWAGTSPTSGPPTSSGADW
jgi:hypothetical protein